MAEQIVPAAEFQALPLDFIIAAPLTAAVKAQAVAAAATRDFISAFLMKGGAGAASGAAGPVSPGSAGGAASAGAEASQPSPCETVDFSFSYTADGKSQTTQISAPLLSMIPVPHLRIDSLTVHFTYEITQTVRDTSQTDRDVSLEAGTAGVLSHWVKASLKGNVSSRSASESSLNRSGQMEITLHASEAPMPEGLSRLLSLLSSTVPVRSQA
jgi:hypothetical protein